MKNKSMIGLLSLNLMLVLGITIALLVSISSQMQAVSASVEGSALGANTSNSNQGTAEGCSPMDPRCGPEDQQSNTDVSCEEDPMCGQAINHINQAQSSLQNGDTEGAQTHMDLAKKALICNPGDPAHC